MVGHQSQRLLQESQSERPWAHLIGASGAGMKGLAEVLLDDGWRMTGSDQNPDPDCHQILSCRGVDLIIGHRAEVITNEIDLVIYSAAVPETNIERQQAETLSIPQLSYSEAVARFVNGEHLVAVAGTHGKSSTTALIASVFEQTGTDITFFCGAQRCLDHRNGKLGNSEIVVVEACEYQRHFLNFRPNVVTLTGIEGDHFDCFSTMEEMLGAYSEFVQLLPENGILIYNRDCHFSQKLASETRCRTVSYSITSKDADWFAESTDGKVQLFVSGKHQLAFPSWLPGKHSLLNLLAALATSAPFEIDLTGPSAEKFLASPTQLKRRFEILETNDSRVFIDDYAHHPTEIEMTLQAARDQYPQLRIVCIFQPHQLSRTQKLFDAFVESLAIADVVYLLPVFGARESASPLMEETSQKLVEKLTHRQIPATLIPSLDQVWSTVETDQQPNDVVLTLGAGDLTRIHNERTR